MVEFCAGEKSIDIIGRNHDAGGTQHKRMTQIGVGFSLTCHVEILSAGDMRIENERSGIVDVADYGDDGRSMGHGKPIAVFEHHVRKVSEPLVGGFHRECNASAGTSAAKLRQHTLLELAQSLGIAAAEGGAYPPIR